ncbi:MAG: DUF4827 family protein [Paludibacter sp.]|nr:DUF4827 family protein [Paludibacter sp.]
MKRIPLLILLAFVVSLIISSCSNTLTYAQELQIEKTTIKNYIKRKGIKLIYKLPKTFSEWSDSTVYYYNASTGLYFHLVDSGYSAYKGDTLELKDKVVPRYIEYSLSATPDTTVNNWSTLEYPRPSSFIYGNTSESCSGFQEAVSYMKRNGSIAEIIIPSKLGFYYLNNDVTPYAYHLKILIQK